MKHLLKLSHIAVTMLVLFTACEKEETKNLEIEGVYKGTLTGSFIKSITGNSESTSATSEITITSGNEIQVHSYSDGFDTIFLMNYYRHNDSAYVCYSGDDFEEMYGHVPGDNHMEGMMDYMHNGEIGWIHHMDEEHDEGDEHFGGFDMVNDSFSFIFRMNEDDTSDDLHFQGSKQ